jgi:1,4-alpha-glucan branching enzyme
MPDVDVRSAVSQITPVGAWRDEQHTEFRVWAPDHRSVELVL